MSYLRGPLTRQQVQILMADQRAQLAARQPAAAAAQSASPPRWAAPGRASPRRWSSRSRPRPAYTPPAAADDLPEAPPSLPEFPHRAQPPTRSTTLADRPATSRSRRCSRRFRARAVAADLIIGLAAAARLHRSSAACACRAIAQYFLPNDVSSQQAIADWERKTNFSRRGVRRRDAGLSPVPAGAGLGALSGSQNAVVHAPASTLISSRTWIAPGSCTGMRPKRARSIRAASPVSRSPPPSTAISLPA